MASTSINGISGLYLSNHPWRRDDITCNVARRFDEKYIPDPNSGCWHWVSSLTSTGYGELSIRGKPERAHRVSYALHNGGHVPIGSLVLHKCDEPSCVNPDHLFLGSNLDNTRDMMKKGRHATQRR